MSRSAALSSLVASLLVVGCAAPARLGPVGVSEVRRLGPEDLAVAAQDVARGPRDIHYKTYRFDAASKEYLPERGGRFEGFLLDRTPETLVPLPDATYTDGRFNRIVYYARQGPGKEIVMLSASGTPDGTRVIGLEEPGRGPRIRLGIVLKDERFLSILGDLDAVAALPCLDAAARRGSLLDLLRCAGLSAPAGAGGGSQDDGLLGDMGALLGDPDCPDDPLGPVMDDRGRPRASAGELRQRAVDLEKAIRRLADDRASYAGDARLREAADAYGRALAIERNATNDVVRAMEALKALQDPDREPPPTPKEIRDAEQAVQAQESHRQAAERHRQQAEAEFKARQRASGSTSPSQPSGLETPPPVDPRCQGRKVDAARGTLFTNPDFCGGDDPITCLRRQQDSLFGLTEGQCWTEVGPDDAPRITCGPADRGRVRPPPAGTPPDPDAGRECEGASIDCWTDPVAPRTPSGRIAVRYVDLTPMGAILVGLCAGGGCPRPSERP
jgi:Sec-independent protein translocase protein TatA